MRHTKVKANLTKPRQQTDPAKANPRGSQRGRLPGHSGKELPAVGKNDPTMAPSSPQPADRSGPAIRPNIGRTDLDHLIAKAKSQIARINDRECYVTAEHWDAAETLAQIRNICTKKGDWERALRMIGLRRQRAWEYLKYRELFASRADAAACPVLKANVLIRKALKADDAANRNAGAAEDCFATPPWLIDVLRRDYGDFGLDTAASHGHAVAERYFTAADDALKQDWVADCGGKPIFMNPPFAFGTLEKFVEKAHVESQRGATVVCVLHFYKSYPWFREFVWQYAEVRMVQGQVIFQGFGSQEGKCAGNKGRMQFDSVVAIFRPGQLGCLGEYIDRLDNGSDEPATLPGDNGTTILLPGDGERDGAGDPETGGGGFETKNHKRKSTLGVRTGVGDEFYTPEYAVRPLLPYLPSNQVIWECAWGTGELAGHLRAAGHHVVGCAGMDFLKELPLQWDIMVTNPPYSHKNAFLDRAYSLGKPFAFLLPVESLGGGRVRLYRQHGIELLVPSKRINFYDAHGQANAASFPTAWFCWNLLPSPLIFVEVDW